MPYGDKKIQIDQAQSKIIAEVICKEIEDSIAENKKYYDRAARSENQYNQVTKWMASNQICKEPWEGAADYFVPLTEWIVDAVWGRVLKVLFNKRPYMLAKGTEASDVEKEDGVTDFVDQIHSEAIDLYDNFKFYIKQMLKLPFAVIKYCWVTEVDRVYEQAQATIFTSPDGTAQEQVLPEEQDKALQMMQSGFIPQGQQPVTALKQREIYNAPKLQYIKFNDYAWAPNTKKGKKPYWESDRFWLTINEMQSNDEFDQEIVEKLRRQIVVPGMNLAQQAIAQRAKLFECWHWYGRLPINKEGLIDFTDPEAIEHEVHTIVVQKEKETLSATHWEYERIPVKERVYLRGGFEETEDFGYRSLCDKLYMTQKELNTFHNHIMNNAMLAMMKIFWKRRTLTGEDWERPQIKPGVFLEIDMPNDIGVFEMGDIKAVAWELEQSFINFAERISNISVYQTGTARSAGGQKTKGEVDRTVYEGNIGIDKFIENCFGVMKKISQWTVDYYYHNMPPGLERRIRGSDAQLIFPTQKNMGAFEQKGILPYWQQDDLAGKFDFKWENTSLNSSEVYQIQVSNDLMERYLPHPMVAGSLLATWDILRRGLIARKITDWQNILPPKEAILAEMQKMQAEAQAQELVGRGERNVKKAAVEGAVKKGVPPDQAIQMLSQLQGGQNAPVQQ